MSGKVLYRKYRPTKLEDVVGQEQVTTALSNSLKQGKIGHAYLFIGPRGTGKTSVARIFAHAVNDFAYSVEDSYLDIVEIDAASNTGVDNIRELREKAVIAPTNGKYKVYIIDEIHMLTKSASNALLKILEEPPEHVIFVMATTDAHKVPITISSRTQVFTFKLADSQTMLQHLKKVAKQEKIKITDDALKLIVRRGGGSFRDSMSLLDQVATLTDQEITAELLSEALGLPQEQAISELLKNYASGNSSAMQRILKGLLNTGIKPETIASELIDRVIAEPKPEWLSLLAKLPEVQPPFPEAKLLLALMARNQIPSMSIKTNSTPSATKSPTRQSSPATQVTKSTSHPITSESTEPSPATFDPVDSADSGQVITGTPNSDAPSPLTADGNFDWDTFLENVRAESNAVASQLQKTDFELTDETLHLYPVSKFTKGILEKPTNTQIITKYLGGLSLIVHNIGDREPPKDETLSQISAIMGDVREIKGDSPF